MWCGWIISTYNTCEHKFFKLSAPRLKSFLFAHFFFLHRWFKKAQKIWVFFRKKTVFVWKAEKSVFVCRSLWMLQYSISLKFRYSKKKKEQLTTYKRFWRQSRVKKRIIKKCFSRLPGEERPRAEKKLRSLRKWEKEAQNGEIASNYLIPDPKRINKPSDFIRSSCSSLVGMARWRDRAREAPTMKKANTAHCCLKQSTRNVQMALIDDGLMDQCKFQGSRWIYLLA